MRHLLLSFAGVMALTACCSCDRQGRNDGPDDNGPSTYFSTYITSDGSKRFVFSQEMAGGHGRQGGPGGGMGGPGGGRGGPQGGAGGGGKRGGDDSEQSVDISDQVNQKLLDTGYCRSGYMELDNARAGRFQRLTGECNETATEADRKQFPNVGNSRLEDLGR